MEIQSVDYKDWYLNQKRIPDKESAEYKPFFNFHKELCLNGAMMGGVYINPFLYWHLNFQAASLKKIQPVQSFTNSLKDTHANEKD